MNNNLIIAAHPDDELLGCGGLISKKIKNKENIRILFLAEGVTSRYNKDLINSKEILAKSKRRNKNAINALTNLGVKKNQIFLSEQPCCRLDGINQLEIVKIIEEHINNFRPNEIYTHWHSDANIDHRIAYQATITATRPVYKFKINLIASYEVLSSTEWNFKKSFNPNYFVDISKNINEKIKSIKMYKDEIRKFPHSRSIKSIKALANYRGAQSGFEFAEAFEVIRMSK